MATQKGNKQAQGSGGMAWSNPVRNGMDVGSGMASKDESDVPAIIVICLAIMALVLVLVIPALAIVYIDMNNATNAAIVEVKKMRQLRAQVLEGLNDNRQPTETTPTEESLR